MKPTSKKSISARRWNYLNDWSLESPLEFEIPSLKSLSSQQWSTQNSWTLKIPIPSSSRKTKPEKNKEYLGNQSCELPFNFRNSCSKDPWMVVQNSEVLLFSFTWIWESISLSLSLLHDYFQRKWELPPLFFPFVFFNLIHLITAILTQQLCGFPLPHVTLLTSHTCTHIPLSSCHVVQPQRATCPEVRKSKFSKI